MKKHLLLLAVALLFVSCGKNDLQPEGLMTKRGEGGTTGPLSLTIPAFDQIVLGDTIPEPTTVNAIRAAYRALYPSGHASYPISRIVTTHYYMRFLPATDSLYLSLLDYDPSDVPLHRKIVTGGAYYHDPSIDEEEYTWQYAIVNVDSLDTEVPYEILQELFIVDEDDPDPGQVPYSFWQTLHDKSFNILFEAPGAPGASELSGPIGAGWSPSGTIKAYDDLTNSYLPVKDVIIDIFYTKGGKTKKKTITTSSTGYFTMSPTTASIKREPIPYFHKSSKTNRVI